MPPVHDPRPLVGEPLALDLLNTQWMTEDGPVDFLATPNGLSTWLASAALDGDATPAVREALDTARAAIRAAAQLHATGEDRMRLNGVLERGRLRLTLDNDGKVNRHIDVGDESWRSAVLAAYNLVELIDHAPDRIRRCDHPNCVLWFFDVSRNGKRRWCRMAACGNRTKAQRFYNRSRTNGEGTGPSSSSASQPDSAQADDAVGALKGDRAVRHGDHGEARMGQVLPQL